MKRLLMISALLIVAVAMVTAVSAKSYFKTGEKAPTFALNSLNGESVSLDSYKGKVIVLGLFHICEPCMIQGSNLQKVYESTRGKNVAGDRGELFRRLQKQCVGISVAISRQGDVSLSPRSGEVYR